MNFLQPFEIELIVAIILGVLELLTGTFIFLGFSLGCLAAAGVNFFIGDFSVYRDVAVFATISCMTIAVLRVSFGRPGDSKRANGDINDY